jgi:hypothetical protein
VNGGTPTTLVSGVYGPAHIAINATSVFWAAASTSGGSTGVAEDGVVMQLTPK